MGKKLLLLLATITACGGMLFAETPDPGGVTARWETNGSTVCRNVNDQTMPVAAPGSAGSVIVVWQDTRNGNNSLYAQCLDKNGGKRWAVDDVGIATLGTHSAPAILSDGAGGAFIVWSDERDGYTQLYAQRVDSEGTPQWTPDGINICNAGGTNPVNYHLSGNAAGGCIVVWSGQGGTSDIFAQKIDADGSLPWGNTGITVCASDADDTKPRIAGDGNGGAVIVWQDDLYSRVHAQRLNADGVPQWLPSADGIQVCSDDHEQFDARVIGDGSGGAIITWADARNGSYNAIYAQRLDSGGGRLWDAAGRAVSTSGLDQEMPAMISDGESGAIIAWYTVDPGSSFQDISVQKIDGNGSVKWNPDGVTLSSAVSGQYFGNQKMISDGLSGAIIAWDDSNNGGIYAQRIDASGFPRWGVQASTVCTADYRPLNPAIAGDDAGGAIIAWYDQRNGDNDIMAQRLSNLPPEITSVTPSSAAPGATVDVALSGKRFFPQPVVSLSGAGIAINAVTFSSEALVTARLTLSADAAAGARDLTLINTSGSSVTVANAFTVAAVQSGASTTTTAAIDPGAAATVSITLPSGNAVTLDIAPGTFGSSVNLTMASASSLPASGDASLTTTALGLDITNDLGLQPLRDITITIHYRHADLGALDESKLVIALFDTAGNRWVPIPSQVYPDLDTVVGRVTHLTTFALVQLAPANSLAGVRAYPVPFNPSKGAMTIDRLTAGAEVRLFTVAGELVRHLDTTTSGTAVWNGKNDSGNTVASGVYIALIKSGAGTRRIKIAVEK